MCCTHSKKQMKTVAHQTMDVNVPHITWPQKEKLGKNNQKPDVGILIYMFKPKLRNPESLAGTSSLFIFAFNNTFLRDQSNPRKYGEHLMARPDGEMHIL